MECEECLTSIEEYLDGELDARAAARVRAHIESCAECASYRDELKAEQSAYAHYRRDVEVTPAMWAALEARIEREKSREKSVAPKSIAPKSAALPESASPLARVREWFVAAFGAPRLSPAFAAALVVVAVGLTVAVMVYLKEEGAGNGQQIARSTDDAKQAETPAPPSVKEAPGADPVAGGVDSPSAAEGSGAQEKPPASPLKSPRVARASTREATAKAQTPEQLVREAEQKYLAAIALVERDVKRRREHLDPALLVKLDNALASIDLTIEETRKVVRQHPGDSVALQYLLGAYSKKIEALREIARE